MMYGVGLPQHGEIMRNNKNIREEELIQEIFVIIYILELNSPTTVVAGYRQDDVSGDLVRHYETKLS